MFTRALLLRLLLTIFSAAIGVFCTGGYAGVVWHTLDIGQPDWSRFLANGRRLFWRLSGSLVLAWPIWGVAYAIAWLRVWRTGSIGWSGLLPIAVGLVPITFFLGLTRFVIVADDARLVTAVRRSVSTVWHDLPIALVLVVGANAVHWAVVTLPVHHILQIMGGGEAARAAYGLRAIPIYLVSSCCSYVLAAWFCATTFLWYRDARTDTGASRPADSAPAET